MNYLKDDDDDDDKPVCCFGRGTKACVEIKFFYGDDQTVYLNCIFFFQIRELITIFPNVSEDYFQIFAMSLRKTHDISIYFIHKL